MSRVTDTLILIKIKLFANVFNMLSTMLLLLPPGSNNILGDENYLYKKHTLIK